MNFAQRWLHRTYSMLLQTDLPIPDRTQDEIDAEVEHNYRWNFAVNLLEGAFFFFGLSFISSATIVPLFVSKLTTSPLAIGLVAVIAQAGWFLPQILTANQIERLPRKKPVIINAGFFLERLPIWLLVVAAFLAASSHRIALVIFLGALAWHYLGAGSIGTAWQELVARCFPVERRGRFLGITMFTGAAMGALGALLSMWLLRTFDFSTNFVYVFLLAAVGITLSWFFLSLTRDPEQPVEVARQSNREFLSKLPDIVRRDRNYRRFLIARGLMALGGMGTGFVTVASLRRWGVADATVGLYTIVYLVGQTLGHLAAGFLADRFGHKFSLELGTVSAVLAFALAWLAPAPGWFFLVFVLLGINNGAIMVSGTLVVLEFSEPRRRPTYAGMTNTITGLVSVAAPLLGAWLATLGYSWVFALSVGINIAAVITMHWWVKEPRYAETIKL